MENKELKLEEATLSKQPNSNKWLLGEKDYTVFIQTIETMETEALLKELNNEDSQLNKLINILGVK